MAGMNFDATKQCPAGCGRVLKYNIVEDQYEFCSCIEDAQKKIPPSKDISLADTFETDIFAVIQKYANTGITVGAMIGALNNRALILMLVEQADLIARLVKKGKDDA